MATPSLVIVPDRYKAGKLYSQIPVDGAGDFTVTRGTTATRVNASGLIESVASGVPRLDYTGGGCPSLLVEPAATNLFLRSEEFDNSYWRNNSLVLVTPNNTTSPSGEMNADFIGEVAVNNIHYLDTASGFSVTNGVEYAFSVFAKYNGRFLNFATNSAGFGAPIGATFDLQNGTVFATIGGTASIESYANGWYRCIIRGTATATATTNINLGLSNDGTLYPSYLGDITKGVFVWGIQQEAGSVATSYIPTVASTITRNADVISLSSVSGLIGQTEGTLYFEVLLNSLFDDGGSGPSGIEIGDGGSFANILSIGLVRGTTNDIRITNRSSSANIVRNVFNLSSFGIYKCAVGYSSLGSSFYVNGNLISNFITGNQSTPIVISSFNRITLGGAWLGAAPISQNNQLISAAAIYTSRLSNSELEAITSL